MLTKALFIFFRGVRLFSDYLRANLLSLLALSALFMLLHVAFSVGSSVAEFTEQAAKFDRIRVYPSDAANGVESSLNLIEEVESVKYYNAQDSKTYIQEGNQGIEGLDRLPEELFPPFFELIIKPEYRNVEELARIAAEIDSYDGVRKTSYGKEWAEQLSKGKNAVISLLIIAAALFALVGAVVIYQTISVSLYRYSKEIRVYSIVGGTRLFVVLPFVMVALFMGLACSLLSFLGYAGFRLFFLGAVEAALGLGMFVNNFYTTAFVLTVAMIAMIAGGASAVLFLRRIQDSDES